MKIKNTNEEIVKMQKTRRQRKRQRIRNEGNGEKGKRYKEKNQTTQGYNVGADGWMGAYHTPSPTYTLSQLQHHRCAFSHSQPERDQWIDGQIEGHSLSQSCVSTTKTLSLQK